MAEAARRELRLERVAADEGAARGAVEAPQPGVAHEERNRPARGKIFRISRVVRGRERQEPMTAVAPHGESERTLGRDMDRVRAQCPELAGHVAPRVHRQADLRVARTGQAAQMLRGEHAHLVPGLQQHVRSGPERRDDAVGLRRPCVAGERDLHAASATSPVAGRADGLHAVRPAQQLQLPARSLDQRRARLDPVAGVAVERAVDVPQVGAVDVAAHHAVVALGRGRG